MQRKSNAEKNNAAEIICSAPWRLTMVLAKDDYCLHVVFVDGTQGSVNLKPLIFSQRAGVFSLLRDITLFKKVYLSYGAVTWPNELDLAPDEMHHQIQQHGHWTVDAQ